MKLLSQRSRGFHSAWVVILLLMGCGGSAASGSESDEPGPIDMPPSAVGAPCSPWEETIPYWSGAQPTTTSLEIEHLACESQLCLSNRFQGRVGCPYGQSEDTPEEDRCLTSDGVVIEVPVSPQLATRRPWEAVHCSCRCDGPDPEESYCTCPDFMMCVPSITESYCGYKDFSLEWQFEYCDRSLSNCEDAP